MLKRTMDDIMEAGGFIPALLLPEFGQVAHTWEARQIIHLIIR